MLFFYYAQDLEKLRMIMHVLNLIRPWETERSGIFPSQLSQFLASLGVIKVCDSKATKHGEAKMVKLVVVKGLLMVETRFEMHSSMGNLSINDLLLYNLNMLFQLSSEHFIHFQHEMMKTHHTIGLFASTTNSRTSFGNFLFLSPICSLILLYHLYLVRLARLFLTSS